MFYDYATHNQNKYYICTINLSVMENQSLTKKVLRRKEKNVPVADIAKELNISEEEVQRIIRRYKLL